MENLNKILTVTKGEVFDTKHNLVVFELESNGPNHRVICRETERCQVINAVDRMEHDTVEAAQAYVKGLATA